MKKSQKTNFENLDGIRIMPDHSDIEDASTLSQLEELIADAKDIGCVEALRKHQHNVVYLLDEKRASYLDVVGIGATDDVLEIGSSMGQHTRLAAKKCNTLSALEIVPLQAKFSKVWCEEEGLDNVNVTSGGMSGKLPYEDNSFDVVVCNYVLEWCAGRHEGSAEEFHHSFLAEIFRTLREGGRLYLSTKNRYSLRYVMGSRDEHLGIRFGSALPRVFHKMARPSSELGHPTGYLHSWAGLERILSKVGFSPIERLLAFPDARYPEFLGRFSEFSKGQRAQYKLSKPGKRNMIPMYLPNPIFEKTTNSLVFIAQKS